MAMPFAAAAKYIMTTDVQKKKKSERKWHKAVEYTENGCVISRGGYGAGRIKA